MKCFCACYVQAEDFEKAQAAAEAASVGVEKWSKTKKSNKKAVADVGGHDPLALIKEQLSQQDIKFEQMSGKFMSVADCCKQPITWRNQHWLAEGFCALFSRAIASKITRQTAELRRIADRQEAFEESQVAKLDAILSMLQKR